LGIHALRSATFAAELEIAIAHSLEHGEAPEGGFDEGTVRDQLEIEFLAIG